MVFNVTAWLTLLHWETLLVVATSDTDDVASPFGSEVIGGDFLGLVSLTVVKKKWLICTWAMRLS